MKSKIVLIVISIFFAFAGCNNKTEQKKYIKKVKTETVQIGSRFIENQFTGVIKEAQDVNLSFRIPGQIIKLNIKEGDYVHKGQIIAELDARDYKIQLEATKAKYEQVIAEVERVKKLYEKNGISDNEYDKAISGEQMIKAKLEAINNQLKDTKLRAPFSGYIQTINFDNYEMVDAGMSIASMIDISNYIVETYIPTSLYVKREALKDFNCTLDVLPNEIFPLQLIAINQKANDNQLYKASFLLKPDEKKRLAPGMNVKVSIACDTKNSNLMKINESAIFYENNKTYLWIVNSNNQITKKEVKAEGMNNNCEIIIKSGLNGGETIVTAGVHNLIDGEKVEILVEKSKSNIGGLL